MALKKKKDSALRKSLPHIEQNFSVVGVGASAGGLDAFRRFLKAIPENSGMAYVLVQHLDPSHQSILPEILRRATKIPVTEITDDIRLMPDHIYVIPENKTLTSTDGVLKLTPRNKIKPNLPINVFFTSLAEVHKSLAVGIVLSGTASDGTLGLGAIKEHGGITFAQDQASAAYGAMPQNAVDAGVVDFVLPPEQIPQKILQESKVKKIINIESGKESDENTYKQIVALLSQHSGVDFTYYKQTTISRRVARGMTISKKEKLTDYLQLLRHNKAELNILFHDLLIPVTSFFRDTRIFQTLNETVFPALITDKSATDPIRIWVAGCSTGDEAYSLAISLFEFLGKKSSGRQIQIFGSDISEVVLAKARAGIYHSAELKNVSEKILKKYFTKTTGGYQVSAQIRDICVFAVHNFLKDPPFAKMDLISCRNVLIYMDTFLQKKALSTFHYALREAGFLLLGKSETAGPAGDLFIPFAKTDKIYSRKSGPGRYIHVATERKEEMLTEKDRNIQSPITLQTDFRKSADAILLSRYMPVNVIVNEQMDIVYIHGVITPFLEAPQGKPSFNLLKMAREGLAYELRNGLHKVRASSEPLSKEGIVIKSNGSILKVNIEIIPLANTVEPYYLILFSKTAQPEKKGKSNNALSPGQINDDENLRRIGQLEKELTQTHQDVSAIAEEQEAFTEELQSANEELLSGSEELQSLNEELETSKEELQSTNEELITINQELQDKQEQINITRLYSEAIVATIREPLVVLDRSLRIRSVNAAFSKKFNIKPEESDGKLIYEIQEPLFNDFVPYSHIGKTLSKGIEMIDYETNILIPSLGEYIFLLNARHVINEKSKEQLVLVALDDITDRKVADKKMRIFSDGLEAMVKQRTASLEQTNLQLEQFAHTASHELQEPLRKIATFSKILKQNYDDGNIEKVKEYLDKIDESSDRMTQLVQHLLDLASLTHGEQVMEKTNLNKILKNVLSDFELSITERSFKIKSSKLPEIDAAPFQMNQLFYDIIGNALKYAKQGVPGVINISSHKLTMKEVKSHASLDQNLSYYELIFKDNGIGFDQKHAQRIFIMFQRLHGNGVYAGTGIGLATCKKIVQNYHGEIFAKGQVNKGAAIHVILPVHQPAA
jgi:two-component system CheB/CheR fusion protein